MRWAKLYVSAFVESDSDLDDSHMIITYMAASFKRYDSCVA